LLSCTKCQRHWFAPANKVDVAARDRLRSLASASRFHRIRPNKSASPVKQEMQAFLVSDRVERRHDPAQCGPGGQCRPGSRPAASAARSSRARGIFAFRNATAIADVFYGLRKFDRVFANIAWANRIQRRQRRSACTLFDYSSAFSQRRRNCEASTFATRCHVQHYSGVPLIVPRPAACC